MWWCVWQVASVFIGAVITFLVSWHFYKKAGEELKREASQIKDALEHGGLIEWKRDKNGDIIGFVLKVKVGDKFSLADATSVQVVDRKADDSKPSE